MSTHSPGPWRANVNAADDLEINAADGRTVVKWYASERCLSPADPRLIIAAPRMLELLRGMQYGGGGDCDPGCPYCGAREFDACRDGRPPKTHAAHCELQALLAEIDG